MKIRIADVGVFLENVSTMYTLISRAASVCYKFGIAGNLEVDWIRQSHEFFRERAMEFLISTGRDPMLTEVDECRDLFKAADEALENVITPLRSAAGITDEILAREYQAMLANLWPSSSNLSKPSLCRDRPHISRGQSHDNFCTEKMKSAAHH